MRKLREEFYMINSFIIVTDKIGRKCEKLGKPFGESERETHAGKQNAQTLL